MQDFKTQTKKVYGLGSAHSGVHHWIHQKFTAIFNIVLVAWFMCVLCHITDLDYNGARTYISQPWNVIFAVLFSVNVFYHAKLGLQTVIEDYVPNHCHRIAYLVIMNMAVYTGMAASIYSIIKIAF